MTRFIQVGWIARAAAIVVIGCGAVGGLPQPARAAEEGRQSALLIPLSKLKTGVLRRGADGKIVLDKKGVGTLSPPPRVEAMVSKLAPRYGLDPNLVLAVIAVESAFRHDAVSPKNAQGLMQLMPGTASRYGVRDTLNPEDNLRGGMRYLVELLRLFKGDLTLALAAYNAGEHQVERYRGVPPFQETRRYIALVHGYYGYSTHPVPDKLAD